MNGHRTRPITNIKTSAITTIKGLGNNLPIHIQTTPPRNGKAKLQIMPIIFVTRRPIGFGKVFRSDLELSCPRRKVCSSSRIAQ